MKFITYLAFLNFISIILSKNKIKKINKYLKSSSNEMKPKNSCTITLIDDDISMFQQNKIFYNKVNISKLDNDLNKDVKEIHVSNILTPQYQNSCIYSIHACEKAKFNSCKYYSGELKQGEEKKLVSKTIKNMSSIKGTNIVQGLKCSNDCQLNLHDSNDKSKTETFSGCGEKINLGNNNFDKISQKSISKINYCSCHINTFYKTYFRGKSISSNLFSTKGNIAYLNKIFDQKIKSIKYQCVIKEKGKLNYLE